MQELAILISSLAGAASAIAIKKFPRGAKLQNMGAGAHIKNQLDTLNIEKDILNKTITRLYENESALPQLHRDKLLLQYQHQLGVILVRIDKLNAAQRYPDLGPIGDGLATLMDQKLSQLDTRLYELSSKITIAIPDPVKRQAKPDAVAPAKMPKAKVPDISSLTGASRPMEITTLTSTSKKFTYPFDDIKPQAPKPVAVPEPAAVPEPVAASAPARVTKPQVPENTRTISEFITPQPASVADKPQDAPQLPLPRPPSAGEAAAPPDDDLEKIKKQILKTLSELKEAEVE